MITRRTAINVATFFVLAVVLTIWGGLRTFGNPLKKPYHVVATFPAAGGVHEHFPVSYNGVVVGDVTSVKLTGDKVRVDLSIHHGTKIPGDVRASVIRASAAGEQRVDLQPPKGGGDAKPLKGGDKVPPARLSTSPDIATVIRQVTQLLRAVPVGQLNTVLRESAAGFNGRAHDLQRTVTSTTKLLQAFLDHQGTFKDLLDRLPPLIDTLSDVTPQFRQALRDTKVLTDLIGDRRPDIVRLIGNAGDLSALLDQFLLRNRANITCLTSDFADFVEFMRGTTLANFNHAFLINQNLFGLTDKIAGVGYRQDVGKGAKAGNDQVWLRVRVLIPPVPPFPSPYTTPRVLLPTYPGAACKNVYGNGVGAATQAGYPAKLSPTGRLVPPSPGDEYAPKAANTGPASHGEAQPATLRSSAAPVRSGPSGNDAPLLGVLAVVVLWSLLVVLPRVRDRRRGT